MSHLQKANALMDSKLCVFHYMLSTTFFDCLCLSICLTYGQSPGIVMLFSQSAASIVVVCNVKRLNL